MNLAPLVTVNGLPVRFHYINGGGSVFVVREKWRNAGMSFLVLQNEAVTQLS